MRILQILPSLNDGGVERGTVDSNRLYVQAGHESWVISAGGKRVEEIERAGGKHVTLGMRSKNPFSAPFRMLALRKALRKIRPDVIHVRSRVPAWLTLWANRAKDLRIPVVSTMHGLNHPCLYSSVMVRADRVICVSTAGEAFVHQHYPWVDEAKLRVIPRGVDLKTFDPAKVDHQAMADFRARFGLEGKWVATAVGRVSSLKGVDVLIRAIAELKDQPDIVALIVGGPQKHQENYLQSLHDLAAELNVTDRVIFAGSQKQIPEIDALSDVVCSCNVRKPESFGRTVAEALAMETPVIASAHGGVLDIVRDGVDGVLVPPGDAQALAQAIRTVRQTTYSGLRAHIEDNFTAEHMVRRTLEVYQELVH